MKKYEKLACAAATVALAIACGGGGDGGGTPTTPQTGVFQDREVAGLSYSTPTQSGVTNAQGEFQYMAGETVTFKVGDVEIGSSVGAAEVTPVDLVSTASTSADAQVQNILVFLQSLDADGNADNGIDVTTESGNFVDKTLDFTKAVADFATELTSKLPAGRTLVSHEQARAHFDSNQNRLADGGLTKTYEFTRTGGNSTTSYGGQIARLYLINAIKDYTNNTLKDASPQVAEADVKARFSALYDETDHSDENLVDIHALSEGVAYDQTTIDDISSGKKLVNKTAGNDYTTDHKPWDDGTSFKGWEDADIAEFGGNILTPEGLINAFFTKIANQSGNTSDRFDVNGEKIGEVYTTEKRQDLNQLIQKFLWGAVAYSQAADDYLSNDTDGKGLKSGSKWYQKNKVDQDYTAVEHAWDEGFGYFGAPINFKHYSDLEIAGKTGRSEYAKKSNDYDDSGKIDAKSEVVPVGHAYYAAKRDADDATGEMDLTKKIFDAFVEGRTILAKAGDRTGGENDRKLTDAETASLVAQRDIVIKNWEIVMLTSSAYYINKTLGYVVQLKTDLSDTEKASALKNYGKYWSELKGFALGLQFNKDPLLSYADFLRVHSLIGDSPELEKGKFDGYIASLEEARSILLDAASKDGSTIYKTVYGNETLLDVANTSIDSLNTTYEFTENTTVKYTGQTARHLLIQKIKSFTKLNASGNSSTAVLERLVELYTTADAEKTEAVTISNTKDDQMNVGDISSSSRLQNKTAGNDNGTNKDVNFIDWTDGESFKGWSDTSIEASTVAGVDGAGTPNIKTPEGLIWAFFHTLASQMDQADWNDDAGNALPSYVTKKRQDLQQLLEKFLWGAVTYYQAADDYMGDNATGKGIISKNEVNVEKGYTDLEHAWDEAFGYYGASRDYNSSNYTDVTIGKGTSYDTDNDGKVDLKTEQIYGHAKYAGKRDQQDPTEVLNLTKTIFEAFNVGRTIIYNAAQQELSADELKQLRHQRNIILENWEKVILATSAHYINDTLDDLEKLQDATKYETGDTKASVLNDYAKHWSELKGFALGLQFSPTSKVTSEQFQTVHTLIGDHPELDSSKYADYETKLKDAKFILLGVSGSTIQSALALEEEFANSGASIPGVSPGDGD